MSVDMFESRTMLEPLVTEWKAETPFLNLFFQDAQPHETEFVDIDIKVGSQKLAPFVKPGSEGRVVARKGSKSVAYKAPIIKPKRATEAETLLARALGAGIHDANSLMARASETLGRDLAEMQDMIDRRKEWMAIRSIVDGSVTMKGYTDAGTTTEVVEDVIDFSQPAANNITLTAGNKFGETDVSIVQYFRDWKRLVLLATGKRANVIVVGSAVADAMLADAEVKALMDNRRLDLMNIDPDELGLGINVFGYIGGGVDAVVYEYVGQYVDEADAAQDFFPVDRVVMGATSARCDTHYGAIMDLDAIENGMHIAKVFPKSWKTQDPSNRFVMLQSRPVPVPHEIGAFVSVKAL